MYIYTNYPSPIWCVSVCMLHDFEYIPDISSILTDIVPGSILYCKIYYIARVTKYMIITHQYNYVAQIP